MKKIEVYSLPFQNGSENSTRLFIDNQEITNPNNRMSQFVVKKPMSKWLKSYKRKMFIWKGFLYELATELNAADYVISFYGANDDFLMFSKEIMRQKDELEKDGRKIKIELVFKERGNCKNAVGVISDIYDTLIYKELSDGNFTAKDKIQYTKDRLNSVSCRVEAFGTMPNDFEDRLSENKLMVIGPTYPKLVAVVFGEDFDGDICDITTQYLKDNKFLKVLALVPKSADIEDLRKAEKNAADRAGTDENSVIFFHYSGDPVDALENAIYTRYMPDIITAAIKDFYDIITVFDDYETDSYITDACCRIDELFE